MKNCAAREALGEVIRRFADEGDAEEFVARIRWPHGVACPRADCGSSDVAELRGYRKWRCRACGRQFSVKVNSIFEDSPVGFNKWLPAMWVALDSRNAVSSCELARALNITQKTAWSMLRRLRSAANTEVFWRAWNSLP